MNVNFDGLASQANARMLLTQALKSGKFPQSVIIEGMEGIGKKKLAMQLADLLVCTDPEIKPCGKCYGCRVQKSKYSDMYWAIPVDKTGENLQNKDKRDVAIYETVQELIANPYKLNIINRKKNISIHTIRGIVNELISRKQAHIQIVFIPEAELLESKSANALLKTLEEVPQNCYFILTTGHKNKLLPTIRSRCLTISLAPLNEEELKDILVEYDYQVDDADLIYDYSGGSAGQAFQFASDNFGEIRADVMQFLSFAFKNEYEKIFSWIESSEIANDPNKSIIFLDILYGIFKDIHCLSIGAPLKNKDLQVQLQKILPEWLNQIRLNVLMDKTQKSIYKIKRNCITGNTLSSLALSFADKF